MKKIMLLVVLLVVLMVVSPAMARRPLPERPWILPERGEKTRSAQVVEDVPPCKLLPEGCEDEVIESNYGVCGEFGLVGVDCGEGESGWSFEENPALYNEFCVQFPNQHAGCE